MEEIAYAKINLALHVRAREPDGYHRIETLFAFAEDGDRLSVKPGEGLSLDIIGPFAPGLGGEKDNLVLRAAEALRKRCGVRAGASLLLDKRLPVASGIGGGSADAAAALRLLTRFWSLLVADETLLEIAGELGADVPACVASRTARGEGRGDVLSFEDGAALSGMPLLLVNPRVPVSTAAVFRAWGGADRGALPAGFPLDAALAGRNDLESPARSLAPEIDLVLAELGSAPGARLTRMSGSGATCFALFDSEDQRDEARERIALAHPHWWQLATRLR
ncbi:MAG TPA: 4-(cytidine 5'-diphospho)-2-C-methyl-D-erythritol kinase [Allosphingosinicella sp.]|nr:4-(cytidine 5'-diphospho)-2-C-methyl-D-erythritol kinase [Allosphingosinicella sp.]